MRRLAGRHKTWRGPTWDAGRRAVRPEVAVELRQYDVTDTSAGLRSGSTDAALLHLPRAATGSSRQLTQEGLFQVVASGRAVALTYAGMQQVYNPPGIAFVPVADLAPAVLAIAWRAEETRDDVGAFVDAVCTATGHAPRS